MRRGVRELICIFRTALWMSVVCTTTLLIIGCRGVRPVPVPIVEQPPEAIRPPVIEEVAPPEFRHGFRYDPMEFAKTDRTLQGAMVRTFVFNRPEDGDKQVLDKRIAEILAEQLPDGSFGISGSGDDFSATNARLLELLQLGVSPDAPALKRTVDYILRLPPPDPARLDSRVYFVRALCLMGKSDLPEVRAALGWLAEHPEEWISQGCPWTPQMVLQGLWAGRQVENVDAAITKGLRWIADNVNDAGCLSYWDPWGFVDCAGTIEGPLARAIVKKQVPMILRAQAEDGGWGEHSFQVLRALAKHDLLEPLREAPALPPDWKVTRSIPAPDGDLFSMAWDGENLWVYDRGGNRAVALSPDDGKILRTLKLPVHNVFGISWWGEALAITQKEPRRLVKVSPETGAQLEEISLDDIGGVLGMAQIGEQILVSDGWRVGVCIIDSAKPADRRWGALAGPGPLILAAHGDTVWHLDFWAPAIIESDIVGRLLDWGERPFDGAVGGLAWDGRRLWALDTRRKRICVIEKATVPAHVESRPDYSRLALTPSQPAVQDSFSLAMQAVAKLYGKNVDYETVYALSTNAFAPDIRQDEECRSSWSMRGRGQCLDLVAERLGLAVRPLGGFAPRAYGLDSSAQVERMKQAAAAIRPAIENGEVVVTDSGWLHTFFWWGIVLEARENGAIRGSTSDGRMDNTLDHVCSFWALSPAEPALTAHEADILMLRRAISRIRGNDEPFLPTSLACGLPATGAPAVPGAVVWGMQAMDLWIAQMDKPAYQELDAPSSAANASLTAQVTSHGAGVAASYLRRIAKDFSPAGRLHLEAAAQHYDRIVALLKPALTGEGGESYAQFMGDLAKQKDHAGVLRQVKAELARAADAMARTLAAEGTYVSLYAANGG